MSNQISKISTTAPARTRKSRRPVMAAMAAILSLGMLSGCVSDGQRAGGNKQIIGSLLGAGLGGWGGSKIGSGKGQLAATAAGVLIGGLMGNSLGGSLDKIDQVYAGRAQQDALGAPIGQTISWSNPDTGNRGYVTPTREGHDNRTGAYCREYQTEIMVGGERQSGYGTACRMPDGNWKVQS